MPDLQPSARIYTYTRVSHREAASGSCSLDWQRDTILGWLHQQRIEQKADYTDDGVSAKIPLDRRPAGKILVEQAVEPGDTILVARYDRIFRDVLDFRTRLRAWIEQGVKLTSCTEHYDLSSPQGLLLATIMAAVSEHERLLTQLRTRQALDTRKAKGLRISPSAPYGWRYVPFGPTRADGSREHTIEPHPLEQWVIGIIVDMDAQAKSLREIAAELTRGKHPTRSGRPWRHSTVADILHNLSKHRAPAPSPCDDESHDPDSDPVPLGSQRMDS